MSDLREKVAKLLHHLSYGEEDDAPSWLLMSEEARSDLLNDADRILSLVDAEYRPLLVQARKALERYDKIVGTIHYTHPHLGWSDEDGSFIKATFAALDARLGGGK